MLHKLLVSVFKLSWVCGLIQCISDTVVSLVRQDVQNLHNICASLPSNNVHGKPCLWSKHKHKHTSAHCSCAITPVHSLSVLQLPGVHLCLLCVRVRVCVWLSSYLPLSLSSTLSSALPPPALSWDNVTGCQSCQSLGGQRGHEEPFGATLLWAAAGEQWWWWRRATNPPPPGLTHFFFFPPLPPPVQFPSGRFIHPNMLLQAPTPVQLKAVWVTCRQLFLFIFFPERGRSERCCQSSSDLSHDVLWWHRLLLSLRAPMPQTPVEALGEADESRQGLVLYLCPKRGAAPAAGVQVTPWPWWLVWQVWWCQLLRLVTVFHEMDQNWERIFLNQNYIWFCWCSFSIKNGCYSLIHRKNPLIDMLIAEKKFG